jgi:hypothetical protein
MAKRKLRRVVDAPPTSARHPIDFTHYYDLAREICSREPGDSHLTDDEITVLAVVASELALTSYVGRAEHHEAETLERIIAILGLRKLNSHAA